MMISVGRRLLLSLAPAIVGLVAAVGLAYYGEYERQAPEWFVVVALVSGVASLVVAWRVTRHVAHRIERLADWHNTRGGALQRAALALEAAGQRVATPPGDIDELDTIEDIVNRLTAAYSQLRAAHQQLSTSIDEQRATYARLVNQAADDVVSRLEEVRLPLHILLENHFGELNENQEEMLVAARHAAEVADQVALTLRDIALQDLGAMPLREDRVRFADLMATILPGIMAEAEAKGVVLDVSIAPALPTFLGDRERLHEALGALIRSAVRNALHGATVHIRAEHLNEELRLTLSGARRDVNALETALAARIVLASGGRIVDTPQGVVIHLPVHRA